MAGSMAGSPALYSKDDLSTIRSIWTWLVDLIDHSFHWLKNPDNTADGHFPNGDKDPNAATLSWDEAALQAGLGAAVANLTNGSSFSHNVRQYLQGTLAASAPITILTTSGDDAATNGFTVVSPLLTNAGTNAGVGFFKLGAADAAGNIVYNESDIGWTEHAAAPTDTTAPTDPTGLTGSGSVGVANLAWDAATDPYVAGASGVKEYDIRLGASIVATIPGAQGLSPVLTLNTIGSGFGTPTAVQGGPDWLITTSSGTAGFHGTASDTGAFLATQLSGDFSIITAVSSFASAYEYSTAGIMIRESLAVGSKFVYWYIQPTPNNHGLQLKARATTDTNSANLASITGIVPVTWLKLERTGNTLTASYSATGGAWTLGATTTLAMASTVYGGLAVASQSATVTVAPQFTQLNINNAARMTYPHTTAVGGAYSIRSRDIALNNSNYCAPLTVIPTAAATLVRWRPGIGVATGTLDGAIASIMGQVVSLHAIDPTVNAVGLFVSWRACELSRGSYTFTRILNDLATLRSNGLYCYLVIQDTTYSGTSRACPDYLATEVAGGIYNKAAGGSTPAVWKPEIMARCQAFWSALGAAIDTNRALEWISGRELDPAISGSEYTAAGFDVVSYATQTINWVDSTKLAFPHTNIGAPGNFSNSADKGLAYVQHCFSKQVGIGGPDLYPQAPYIGGGSTKNMTNTDHIIRGEVWNGAAWVSGGTDYRGKIFCCNQVQDPDMGRGYTWPPDAFYQYVHHMDGLPQSHLLIWPKDYAFTQMAANLQTYWSSTSLQPNATLRFKSYLQSGLHSMLQTPPSFYNGAVDTAP